MKLRKVVYEKDIKEHKNEYIAPQSQIKKKEETVIQGGGFNEVTPTKSTLGNSYKISQEKLRKFVNLQL